MSKADTNQTTSGNSFTLKITNTGSGTWGFSNVYIIASYCHS